MTNARMITPLTLVAGLALPAAAQTWPSDWNQRDRPTDSSSQSGAQFEQLGTRNTWRTPGSETSQRHAQSIKEEAKQLSRQAGEMWSDALPPGWVVASYDFNGDARFDVHELIHVGDLDSARYNSWQRKQSADVQPRSAVGPLGRHARDVATSERQRDYTQTRRLTERFHSAAESQKRELAQEARQLSRAFGQGQGELPAGWAITAIDLDGDARYEVFELINLADLDRARMAARDRKQAAAMPSDGVGFQPAGDPWRQQTRQDAWRSDSQSQIMPRQWATQSQLQQQPVQLRGEVKSLSSIRLLGQSDEHLIAKIETDAGRNVAVDLGPKTATSRLDLDEGDSVVVIGEPKTINQQPVICATQVERDGRVVMVNRPYMEPLVRVKGEVLGTQTLLFRGADNEHLIARIRCDDGRTMMVDLGPRNDLDQNIESGDELLVLAKSGSINGQPAMLARHFCTDGGSVVAIRRDTDSVYLTTQNRQTATVPDEWDD